jgi:hypothetical protein
MVEKKLRRNLAPINEDKVGATAVKIADAQTKNELTPRVIFRPLQSHIQVNKAPAICPIWNMENTKPVEVDPVSPSP